MENDTRDLKQDIKGTASNNEVVGNSFTNEERQKTYLVDKLGEEENPDGLNNSPSERQEKLATDDGNKNNTTPSVDSAFDREIELKITGIKDGVQSSKKKSNGSGNFVSNTEELQRGRAEVIRLQAVSHNPQQSVDKSSLPTVSAATHDKVYINEDMDIITSEPLVSSQGEYILAAQLKEVPMYITQNDLQNVNPNVGSDILQTAVSSITENIGSAYQHILLDVVQAPEYTMLKAKKTSDVSSVKGSSWTTTSTSSSTSVPSDCSSASNVLYQTSSSENSDVLNGCPGIDSVSGIIPTQTMEHFVTADNQVVYGYKDSNGEMHFFSPAPNDRENHNEKERRRRSRVSVACNSLRKMIPGISEKTDKATVFEQTAKYLKFLRDKFGTQFDQAYYEKYFQRRKC